MRTIVRAEGYVPFAWEESVVTIASSRTAEILARDPPPYRTGFRPPKVLTTGKPSTTKFRIHAIRLDIPGGHKMSYWHDLPLVVADYSRCGSGSGTGTGGGGGLFGRRARPESAGGSPLLPDPP